MMKKHIKQLLNFKLALPLLACLLLPLTLLSGKESPSSHSAGGDNSIYYWRTTFKLSPEEKDFLRRHDVNKIYMRFFDVDYSYDAPKGEPITPEATIVFKDTVPEGIEVVPTVYITIDAIKHMPLEGEEYAEKIFKRVNAICKRNNIRLNELQLDCDWTKTTRESFFKLCEAMKQQLDSTQSLSSTIRLHQLVQTPPPVDKGVLMVYNTGNLMDITTGNSIFSERDIKPYLRDNRLADYQLPLDVAYPAYSWSLVYYASGSSFTFNRIMRRTDFSAYPDIKKIGTNLYKVTSWVEFTDGAPGVWDCVRTDDRIRVERPTAEEILKVKTMIDAQLKGKNHGNILYHLDDEQLSHYSDDEISEIYTRN